MPASGSSIFTNADGYQKCVRDILNLVALHPSDFNARLTWVELPELSLLRAQEGLPRLAYMTLPARLAFITFLTQRGTPLIHGGSELQFGELLCHSLGEHAHQRTTGPTNWGSVAMTPTAMMAFGRAVAGRDLAAPSTSQIVRPRSADLRRLLRLHSQACRIAETVPKRITNQEVARALEQDLIWALITCLDTATLQDDRGVIGRRAQFSMRLEQALARYPTKLWRGSELANAIGISESALRSSCLTLLGMSVARYQHLRRLERARAALMHADPATERGTDIVKQCGFANFERFVADYWKTYGEMPPIPPRGSSSRYARF
jgi:AraC-like DNA-binding protein